LNNCRPSSGSDTTTDEAYSGSETSGSSTSSVASNDPDAKDPNKVQLHSLYASPSYQETVKKQNRIIIYSSDEEAYEGLGSPAPKKKRLSNISERDRYTGNEVR